MSEKLDGRIALVTGSAAGLGKEIAVALSCAGYTVLDYDLNCPGGDDVLNPRYLPRKLDVLVNCAAANRIDWLKDVKEKDWDTVMDVNVKGIFLMTQALERQLRESRGTIVNIVSNAAQKPMRCSAAYNASKGAALMLTKQLARELAPDITVFSVSPNKLKNTEMSKSIEEQVIRTRGWTKEEADAYQLSSMLPGVETCPKAVARFVAYLLDEKENHRYLAGCDLQYGI